MWQAMKDKKRRVAQKVSERRRSTTEEDVTVARSIPYDEEFVEKRSEFKEYLKTTKDIQKKVTTCATTLVTALEAFKVMCESFDEMEGGYETSRGDKWLAEVDRFQASAQVQIEGTAQQLLEVLAKRHQAAKETQQGITSIVNRETDLRSYERRVHEATTAKQPKPEKIQKFTSKLENAKQDCLTQTTTVKADLQYMQSTKLSAHQPAFDTFFTMIMHVLTKTSELSNPGKSNKTRSNSSSSSGISSGISSYQAKASAMGASGMASMAAMAGSNRPPQRSAPMPGSGPPQSERSLPQVPPVNDGGPPPLPPKDNSAKAAAFGASASAMGMSAFGSAKSTATNAKAQAQQHKEQFGKEQKAASRDMALGYMTGGNKGAMNAAKKSAKASAKSHGSEIASKNAPPNRSAPVPGSNSGAPNKKAPTPGKSMFANLQAKAQQGAELAKQKAMAGGLMQAGAVALFDFEPENPDELKLKAGEEIFDIVDVEDDWCKGTTKDGRTGVFPSNYIKKN